MRVLCLVDERVEPPDRWLWNYLPAHAQLDDVDFLHPLPGNVFPKWGIPKWGKLLVVYPAYWNLAIRALRQCRKTDYDLIVAWQSKNGFWLAVLRSLLGLKDPKFVILSYSFKRIAAHFLKLSRWAMRGVDHFTVFSSAEVGYYSKLLGISPEKITFCPFSSYDMSPDLDLSDVSTGNYIFAGGRSYRDYGTLFEAMSGLDVQLVVNAHKFNVQGLNCPPNVTINDFLPLSEFYALVAGARFVVLPLEDIPHAAGIGHVVYAMSAGKALVATRMSSTVDYIEDGQTGILVAPYDVQEMRSAIAYLLAHPWKAEAMGRRARQRYEEKYTFAAFAERTYEVLRKVVGPGKPLAESGAPV